MILIKQSVSRTVFFASKEPLKVAMYTQGATGGGYYSCYVFERNCRWKVDAAMIQEIYKHVS